MSKYMVIGLNFSFETRYGKYRLYIHIKYVFSCPSKFKIRLELKSMICFKLHTGSDSKIESNGSIDFYIY